MFFCVGDYYAKGVDEAFAALASSAKGLSSAEAAARFKEYGPNELQRKKRAGPLEIFLNQFKNFLILLLFFAAGVSAFLGELLDAAAMLSIVVLSAVLGFIQEYRAEKAIEALEKISAPTARVLRDGTEHKIAARDLVPGDVVLLEAGDIVPADARLFEVASLQVDEASLTGESVPSDKDTNAYPEGTSVADQENMAFMGTVVTYGKARAVVTATGMRTELGAIAESIQETPETETPLQRKFEQMARQIAVVVIALTAVIFVIGVATEKASATTMLIFAISLAVAAVPSSLPAIVTISLGLGVRNLARRNMIIKKLPAAESLGSVTVICSDKTGTMTRNEMTVTKLYVNGGVVDVSGTGYAPDGAFTVGGKPADPRAFDLALRISAVCNNAHVSKVDGRWEVLGDPTEGALVVVARKAGLERDALLQTHPLVQELPFDSERKRMSVVVQIPEGGREAYVKGAPELVLKQCTRVLENGAERELSDADRKRILAAYEGLAAGALRVLGLAYRRAPDAPSYDVEGVERDLTFVGLAGLMDPPRSEVREAIAHCGTAGIQVMMITGDHAVTARAVAEQIGLFGEGDVVMTGDELDALPDAQLVERIDRVRVFARALPIQKSRIVDALKQRGHVVAMTGDGVNDAPALKKADIGISMGITGTDVSREVSKATLADDNFATIVNAIEEGRNIYDKIIKSTRYLLSCNAGEIVAVFTAIVLDLPLPMIPLQILLMNLLTDGLPALGLGMEPSEKDVMNRPPRDPRERPLSNPNVALVLLFGLFMGFGTFLVFTHYLPVDLKLAQTAAFTTLVMFEMFAVVGSRSLYPLRKLNPLSNVWLSLGIATSIALQFLVIYWEPLQPVFGTVPLGVEHWLVILGAAALGYAFMEAAKVLIRFVPDGTPARA